MLITAGGCMDVLNEYEVVLAYRSVGAIWIIGPQVSERRSNCSKFVSHPVSRIEHDGLDSWKVGGFPIARNSGVRNLSSQDGRVPGDF